MARRKKDPAPAEGASARNPNEQVAATPADVGASPAPEAPAPAAGADGPPAKRWANPYRATFTCPAKGFELGENRRFNQLVFTFKDNPGPEVTGKLKEAGFVYRGQEKAWTITASAANREIADGLAFEFKGEEVDRTR